MLVYLAATLFLILTLTVAFRSLSDFVVSVFLWAVALGWYFFVFDCFGIRNRCKPLESLRGKVSYFSGALFCMALWLAV